MLGYDCDALRAMTDGSHSAISAAAQRFFFVGFGLRVLTYW